MEDTHICTKNIVRARDFLLGVNSPVVFEERVPSGDWENFLPDFDKQKERGLESDACVPFTAVESVETQINFLISSGKVPYEYTKALGDLGFLDAHNHFEASERYIANLDGTSKDGTAMYAPWDAIRKYGLVPYKDWPFDASVKTWEEFYKDIPPALLEKGRKFLTYFDISYEWIIRWEAGIHHDLIIKHLKQAPLCIGIPVCQPWNQVQPPTCPKTVSDHAIMCYRRDTFVHVLDHYDPAKKNLAANYPIVNILKGIVSVKPLPIPILPEQVAPTVANLGILQRLLPLYQYLLALWKRSQSN